MLKHVLGGYARVKWFMGYNW